MSEIIFTGQGDATFDRLIQRRAKKFEDLGSSAKHDDAGGLAVRRLHDGIYTTNLRDAPTAIIRRNLWQILAHIFPGAVISGRTGLEMSASKATSDAPGFVFLTSTHKRSVSLPGLEVRAVAGPGKLPGDTDFMGLIVPSPARKCLENLAASRARFGVSRTVGPEKVEEWLVKQCEVSGEQVLNQIRDAARALKEPLNAHAEFELLHRIIGSLLGSRNDTKLTSDRAIAYAAGEPFDPACVERLNALFAFLSSAPMPDRKDEGPGQAKTNTAFIEAYFSNYIEGTTFLVQEAAEIVFEGKIPENRPADGHDVLSTFTQLSDYSAMRSVTTANFEKFIEQVKSRHSLLMGARPDVAPGSFKSAVNRAGNTVFVHPEQVIGTFRRGFELLGGLKHPFARGVFLHFLVSDIHPFNDGNGRMARIMMANELTAGGQSRVVVPTVFRDDYLAGQRSLTRHLDPAPNYRMLMRAQEVTSRIVEEDLSGCINMWASTHAFVEPGPNAQLTSPDPDAVIENRNGVLAPASYWEAEDNPTPVFGV